MSVREKEISELTQRLSLAEKTRADLDAEARKLFSEANLAALAGNTERATEFSAKHAELSIKLKEVGAVIAQSNQRLATLRAELTEEKLSDLEGELKSKSSDLDKRITDFIKLLSIAEREYENLKSAAENLGCLKLERERLFQESRRVYEPISFKVPATDRSGIRDIVWQFFKNLRFAA